MRSGAQWHDAGYTLVLLEAWLSINLKCPIIGSYSQSIVILHVVSVAGSPTPPWVPVVRGSPEGAGRGSEAEGSPSAPSLAMRDAMRRSM